MVPYPGGNGSFPPNTPLGTVATVQSGSGNAWVIGADSEIPGTTLHVNGQYASSRFDFPGSMGQNDTHASDDAYSIGLGLTQPLGKRWNLALNAAYQDIGTYFTSLANPTLSPDRRTANATGTLSGYGLAASAGGGFTEDNTDNNPAIATVRSLPRTASLSYGPTLPASVTTWLGTPSVNLSWQDARTHDTTAPMGSEPTASDVVNDTLGFNFAYTHFSWQAGLTGGKFRDYTGQQDDTDTFGPAGGFNVSLGGKGFLSANLQLLDAHDLKNDTHTLDRNYSLSGGDSFWQDRLSAQLTFSINHNTQQIVPGTIPPQLVGNDVVLKTATAQLCGTRCRRRAHGPGRPGTIGELERFFRSHTSALTTQGFSAPCDHRLPGILDGSRQMAARLRRSLDAKFARHSCLTAFVLCAQAHAAGSVSVSPNSLTASLQSTLPTLLIWTVKAELRLSVERRAGAAAAALSSPQATVATAGGQVLQTVTTPLTVTSVRACAGFGNRNLHPVAGDVAAALRSAAGLLVLVANFRGRALRRRGDGDHQLGRQWRGSADAFARVAAFRGPLVSCACCAPASPPWRSPRSIMRAAAC